MPLWGLSTSRRAAVELDSDDDRVSASTGSRSASSTSTRKSLSRPSPQLSQESPPLRQNTEAATAAAAVAVAHPNRFTSGAGSAARGFAASTGRQMILGVPSTQQLTVQAIHQRVQSAQQPRCLGSACSSVDAGARATSRAQSLRSSRGGSGSFAFTARVLNTHQTMNVLVLGSPQVGKSLFINAYRAAVTNTTRWPAAPVGISGFYGTTTVEPFPNHPREPTWLCIDTPGHLYTAENEVILEKLAEGVPWRTKLVGPKSLTLGQVSELAPVAANRAHQCVIVVPATDLIEDEGWMAALLWRSRYRPAGDVAAHVLYLKHLTSSLRALMDDVSPFVVVTKMDKFGGAGNGSACAAVTSVLSQCVPVNRVYFAAAVENRASLATGRAMVLESSTKQNLIRLHEDICLSVQWHHQLESL